MWHDIRYAFRLLARNPGFSLVAVLTLALALSASSAVFTYIDITTLRSLPVAPPWPVAPGAGPAGCRPMTS